MKEIAKKFYITEWVSEATKIGSKSWGEIKHEVCSDEKYQEQEWYKSLSEDEIALLSALKKIQLDIGIDQEIPAQMNPVKANYIEKRIDELFPFENFYFFKIFKGESEEIKERNKIEQEELLTLIEENINSERYFIKSGLLEPIHLTEDERDLLVDGMQSSISKIAEEVIKSKEISMSVTQTISDELAVRIEETL